MEEQAHGRCASLFVCLVGPCTCCCRAAGVLLSSRVDLAVVHFRCLLSAVGGLLSLPRGRSLVGSGLGPPDPCVLSTGLERVTIGEKTPVCLVVNPLVWEVNDDPQNRYGQVLITPKADEFSRFAINGCECTGRRRRRGHCREGWMFSSLGMVRFASVRLCGAS